MLQGCDQGEWSLPSEVLEARDAAARVAAALARVPEVTPLHDLRATAVQTARSLSDPTEVDLSAVLDHSHGVDRSDTLISVLRSARGEADGDLTELIRERRDTIIAEHLRPAGEAAWSAIAESVQQLGDLDVKDATGLVQANSKVRRAWLDIGELANRYHKIREVLERLQLHVGDQPRHDQFGDHAEFERGLCCIVGPGWRSAPMAERRQMPWPAEPRARLTWIVRNGHQPWFPTTAERDRSWLNAHRAEHDQAQHQQY